MNNLKKKIGTKIADLAYRSAEKEANKACPYFHGQERLPEKVNELRKFRKYDK